MKLTAAHRTGIALAVPTGLYAVSFGALGVAAGLSILQVQLLSLVMFTGGSQFAFVGALAGGPMTAAGSAVLLGVRNMVYGAEMNVLLRPRGLWVPLQAQMTIDESFAAAVAQDDLDEQRRAFWTAGVGIYLTWNTFTLVGSLLGAGLGDPKVIGLDGAAVAAFLGLLWPRLKNADAWLVAVVSAVATALTFPYLPAGVPLLVAAAVAAALGIARKGGTR